MTPMEQTESSREQAVTSAEPDDIDSVDVILGILTVVPLLFVLMFATSGMAERLKRRASRRRLGVVLLALEVVVVLGIIAWVMS